LILVERDAARRAEDDWQRLQSRIRDKIKRLQEINHCSLFVAVHGTYMNGASCNCTREVPKEEAA
jgi:Skp family chaperone for outer membrane proteins